MGLLQWPADSFCHSSWQNFSSCVRLDGERWCTDSFRSRHRFSIGLKSGDWLGHSQTDFLASKPSFSAFWHMLGIVILKLEITTQVQSSSRLQQVCLQYFLVLDTVHDTLDGYQLSRPCHWKTASKHDRATAMFYSGDGVMRLVSSACYPPNHLTTKPFVTWSWNHWCDFWQSLFLACLCIDFRRGFFLATLLCRPDWCITLEIVDARTSVPVLETEAFKSSSVALEMEVASRNSFDFPLLVNCSVSQILVGQQWFCALTNS